MLVLFETNYSIGEELIYGDSDHNFYIIRNEVAFPISIEALPELRFKDAPWFPSLTYQISEHLLAAEGIYFQKGRLVKPVPHCIRNILRTASLPME